MDVFGLPLSINSILFYLIDALIAWIAIIISDKVIAHEIEAKRTLVLALAAFFIVPLALQLLEIGALIPAIIVSLIVWIGLGELILEEISFGTKLKVLIVAFGVYYAISFFFGGPIYSLILGFF